MKIDTYLPIFNFENGQWDIDYSLIENDILEARQEKKLFSEVDFNKIDFDFIQYEKDITENAIDIVKDLLSDFINGIDFQDIKKHSVNVSIDIKENEIASFIYANKEKFCQFLKNRYTSYDGFMSHYANDFETWENDTKNFLDFSINGHYLGSVLDFIAIENKIDNYSIYDLCYENIYFNNYVKNYDDLINQSDNSLFDFLTQADIKIELAEYIQNTYSNGFINQLNLPEKILSIIKDFENFQIIE